MIDDRYERHKEDVRRRHAEAAASFQEIGPLPAVLDPERRAAGLASFKIFCESYLTAAFPLAWSPDHLKAITKIERAVIDGELFAHAMPRGSGKTTLAMAACIWSIIGGRTPFVCLVAASAKRAKELLAKIKTWCETIEPLNEDFPEIFYPIRKLERITNRQKGQKYLGEPTRISWLGDKIVFPTMPNSPASGAVMTVSGLKGSDIRGQLHGLANGELLRPTLVFIDDPQTRESAGSELQTQQREEIIGGDILGMAGPGKKIAGIMCCTVIRPDDLSARMLDREKHPEWSGEITRLVYEFPTATALWDQYADLRRDLMINELSTAPATQFYENHRAEMDAGFVGSWPARFNVDEISDVQYAMNLMYRDRAVFFAEYQNDPIPLDAGEKQLTADEIAAKLSQYDQRIVPNEATRLTAFIDVQKEALYYVVTAWASDFTGYVVDYGTWPDQRRAYFGLSEIRNTIEAATQIVGLEGSLFKALGMLTGQILGREWQRGDGSTMKIERCLIDAGWGNSTEVVYQFARKSHFGAVITPSHGKGVKSSDRPLNDFQKKMGDRIGLHWRVPVDTKGRPVRHVLFDTNYWKSHVHRLLSTPDGARGCLSLFGKDAKRHAMIADHLTAEYCIRTQRKNDTSGREVDEWKMRVGRSDNHWLDCLVGCAVAASMLGCDLINPGNVRKPKERKPLSQMGKA